jgi:hypothetical protein
MVPLLCPNKIVTVGCPLCHLFIIIIIIFWLKKKIEAPSLWQGRMLKKQQKISPSNSLN